MDSPALKITLKSCIEVADWDAFVKAVYDRPYSFQQQAGCREKGTFEFKSPWSENDDSDEIGDVTPHIDCNEQCVDFDTWRERDPKEPLDGQQYDWELDLWWERQFYPPMSSVVNDLHQRGLLAAGSYVIEIDW